MAILTYSKHMFYEEICIKQCLSYISFCSFRILYNSKFILMATSLERNAVVVTRVGLLFVALWFILRGDLLYVFPCVILFFPVLLVLRLPSLGKTELILVLFVRLFGLCLFRFVGFLFSWGLGRAAVCDCGTPWTFLLPLFHCSKYCHTYQIFHCPSRAII